MVWGERAVWVALVAVVAVAASRYEAKRARAVPPPAPVGLSAEVRAYVDQRCAARTPAAATPPPAGDPAARLAKMAEEIKALEATAEARNAAQAECVTVHTDFRKLFDKQKSVLDLVRDQEIGRMRNRTAETCAKAADAGAAGSNGRARP